MLEARTVKLHELADHPLPAQHFGDGQHEIRGGDAVGKPPRQLEPHHLGDQHGDGLAEHDGLRLDAADAPAEHRQSIDHGGVTVGADESVGEGKFAVATLLAGPHNLRQIFEIDLMADARARRHHAEIVEGARAPAQEGVTLAVARIFLVDIGLEGARGAKHIHHHRVVDDKIDRRQRIDHAWIAAKDAHGIAHGGHVDHGRNASEVLHQHAGGAEGDFAIAFSRREPVRHAAYIVGGDTAPVLVAQQILQQNLQREREPRDALKPIRLGLFEAVVAIAALADLELAPAFEAVEGCVSGSTQREVSSGPLSFREPDDDSKSRPMSRVRGRERPLRGEEAKISGVLKPIGGMHLPL